MMANFFGPNLEWAGHSDLGKPSGGDVGKLPSDVWKKTSDLPSDIRERNPRKIPSDTWGDGPVGIQRADAKTDAQHSDAKSASGSPEKESTEDVARNAKDAGAPIDENGNDLSKSEISEENKPRLTEEEKAKIKEETNWSGEIVDNIRDMRQYEILKNAGLKEVEINGKKCLIKENVDLDYKDRDDISNRDRMARGLAPLDSKTVKPIELHHLGQKADSPLVELTEEEHRTGEYDGEKAQSIWHDNTIETEVHGEGNNWNQERKEHWETRYESSRE